MNRECGWNEQTKAYLREYYRILDEMIRGMISAKLTDSISHNFIVQMIPHHRAAIEMSRNILQYTCCTALQDIALNIISEQTRSIENMQRIFGSCSMQANGRSETERYQWQVNQILGTMFSSMEDACADNDLTDTFMRQMIPHHEGAVRMVDNVLQFHICQELDPILYAIWSSQTRGIARMQDLLRCGCG